MEYNGNYNYEEDSRDLYSSSGKKVQYEDVYSRSRPAPVRQPAGKQPVKRKKKKKHTGRTVLCVVVIVICCIILALGGAYAYVYKTIDKIEREPLDTADLGITTDNYSSVKNIAFLGIDTREDNDVGRSDAILILTVDSKNKKFKLTSIARDTYVEIDGHKNDKLTHAYAYGKSQLAVKTLNKNFGLEITDYVAFNFFGLSRIIDNIGGVTIDVTEE
ncbi:MAG: LCP family protein, partial [Acutalibacteraceae bacterium]|nr:LCP family protein [Acutalibacteraceae bacterium]